MSRGLKLWNQLTLASQKVWIGYKKNSKNINSCLSIEGLANNLSCLNKNLSAK